MPTMMHLDGDDVKDLLKAKVGSQVSFVVRGKLESLTIPHERDKKKPKKGEMMMPFDEKPSARIYISSIEGMKVGKNIEQQIHDAKGGG